MNLNDCVGVASRYRTVRFPIETHTVVLDKTNKDCGDYTLFSLNAQRSGSLLFTISLPDVGSTRTVSVQPSPPRLEMPEESMQESPLYHLP